MAESRPPRARCRRSAALAGILILLAAGAAFPQARPAYEAASLKPNISGRGDASSHGSQGQVLFSNQTLKRLVERAYNVKPFQVTGPPWLEDLRFDVAAKYPPDAKFADRPLMLRTLLEDRLKLAAHRETKDLPGYALVVAKGGFKLKPVPPGDSSSDRTANGLVETLTARKVSMALLADLMTRILGEAVVDRTALDAVYDLDLRWAIADPNPSANEPDPAAFLLNAIQDTLGPLGLHLQRQKVPVEVIVVDHVERVPLEN